MENIKILVYTSVVIIFVLVFISGWIVLYKKAPRIPSVLKPLFPPEARWKTGEIIDQIKSKNIDKDFFVYFNRDPERQIPKGKNIIVAPADGTIKVIKNLGGKNRIVIYMSFWDVHIQRVPISGIVTDIIDSEHQDQDDFKCENCYQEITKMETEIGEVEIKQVTSFFAPRIKTFLTKGQEVKIGDKLGSILLGSHVVIEFREDIKICVAKGDKVYGGESIIARY